jgi:hypothetical protein
VKTIKELAQNALHVQNACNLSGVAIGFGRAMVDLRETLESVREPSGTDDLRSHPIAIVWADKIASLTDTQELGNDRVMSAFREVGRLAEQ